MSRRGFALAPLEMAHGKWSEFDICNVGAHLPYSSLLVKGDEVAFFRAADGAKTTCPASFFMLHDITKKHFRRCDFFLARPMPVPVCHVVFDEQTVKEAKEYYGNSTKLVGVGVDLPVGPWKSVGVVDEIHYRRRASGRFTGPYFHPYDPHVPLYASSSGMGWRVQLPEGCVVNWHGFITP